jgi:hypothetical protein
MPRRAPDQVIEHRIALSSFEREKIVEELTKARENRLYSSAINQIGGIAGSSALMYGLALYFGLDLLGNAKDYVQGWIDTTSDSLADMIGSDIGLQFTTEEAAAIKNAFDRLDEAIVYHRNAERANSAASQGAIARLRSGEITMDEFAVLINQLSDEASELDKLRNDIVTVRANVRNWRNGKASGTFTSLPAWLAIENWRDLITAGLEGGYSPNGG